MGSDGNVVLSGTLRVEGGGFCGVRSKASSFCSFLLALEAMMIEAGAARRWTATAVSCLATLRVAGGGLCGVRFKVTVLAACACWRRCTQMRRARSGHFALGACWDHVLQDLAAQSHSQTQVRLKADCRVQLHAGVRGPSKLAVLHNRPDTASSPTCPVICPCRR